MKYSVRELAEITASEFSGDGNLIVEHFAFDSRAIFTTEKTAFLAITTTRNSGEKYIQQAIDKGIKIIISTSKLFDSENITWIIVKDTILFLQKLAAFHRKELSNLKTIGITGSNGKTIVKEWLFQCINSEIPTVKSPKSFNSQIGLPISILQANKNHQIGIFEVGISRPGEMEIQQEILNPQIGILTNIGTAHAGNFENENQLIKEKLLLFKNSETVIFNGDNELVLNKINRLYSNKTLISFGFNKENDIHPVSDFLNKNEDVRINIFGEEFSFPAKNRDRATIANVMCVIAVLNFLGFNQEQILEKINALTAIEMRLESVAGIQDNLIINDSYNLDSDSLKIAFQFINEYQKKKRILILTDFAEIQNPEDFYPQIISLVNAQNFTKVFLIGQEITNFQNQITTESYSFDNVNNLIESHELNKIENSVILIKGARKFKTEEIKNHLQLQKHDTVLEVKLNSLLHNINVHKEFLKPETKMMAMVKAFAYGTGGFEIAEFLQHHHIDYLGVAYADEGADLRKAGITVPVMVMNPEQHSYDSIIDHFLEPEIYSFRVLELFSERLKAKGIESEYPIHIKLETGMHRLGFKEDELDYLTQKIKDLPVKVKSIFSHLSTADLDDGKDYAKFQLKNFDRMSGFLIEMLGYRPTRHMLNSAGITVFPEFQYDMVRIGIGMYGISAIPEVQKNLQSVVSFKTVISQISEVKTGESVGYGRRFKAKKNTRIATIPVGYADGIPRLIGNGSGKVGIGGKLFPIAGGICMDMMMIDLGNFPANEGDEVVIFNSDPSLEEFAEYCKTIPYEVLTSVSRRVKRIYIKD